MRSRVFIGLLALLVSADAGAASYTWDGGGSDDNLSTAKNWVSNSAPPSGSATTLRFGGLTRPTPFASKAMDTRGLVFLNTSSPVYELSGAQLGIGLGGIVNGNAKAFEIHNDLRLIPTPGLTGAHAFLGNPGELKIHGDIDLQSYELNARGPGQTRIYGDISGINGQVSVGVTTPTGDVPGTLVLSGLVNADVDTRYGTLVIDTNQPQPAFTTLTFEDGTSFRALGTHTINNALRLNGDVTFDGSGALLTDQTVTGPGTLTLDASPTGRLRLGPVNNITPFAGAATVDGGQLELNGGGVIAQLAGPLAVGDGAGGAGTAVLRGLNPGVLAPGLPLTVAEDGLVELAGPVTFASVDLTGGDLVGDSPVSVPSIQTHASARTASFDAPWSMPTVLGYYVLTVEDGPAQYDAVLGGCDGTGTLVVTGGGRAVLEGDASTGPWAIEVDNSGLLMDRGLGTSFLSRVDVTGGELTLTSDEQLGSGCTVFLLVGSTMDLAGTTETTGELSILDSNLTGGGDLTIHGRLVAVGAVDVEPTLHFADTPADIETQPSTQLAVGRIHGGRIDLVGGGRMTADRIDSDFRLESGTLNMAGTISGDLDVHDRLEIPVAGPGPALIVTGDVACQPSATLSVDMDASGAAAGDEFVLMQYASIAGSFRMDQLPASPPGHHWTLVYTPTELRLRLDASDRATLDLTAGTNGRNYPFPDDLSGTVGVDLTVLGGIDRELCAVTVDSVTSPLMDSTLGVRLYRSADQALLASSEVTVPQTAAPLAMTFPLDAVLQAGEAYRVVLYGAGSVELRTYERDLAPAYLQSTLLQINAVTQGFFQGDGYPTGTWGRIPHAGLVLGPCGASAVEDEETPAAPAFALTAYPNPFNPATTAAFDLPRTGPVRLEVFDARGRRVARPVDGIRPSGRFEVRWEGTADSGAVLGSGVYFLRLEHPAGVRVQRVTMLK